MCCLLIQRFLQSCFARQAQRAHSGPNGKLYFALSRSTIDLYWFLFTKLCVFFICIYQDLCSFIFASFFGIFLYDFQRNVHFQLKKKRSECCSLKSQFIVCRLLSYFKLNSVVVNTEYKKPDRKFNCTQKLWCVCCVVFFFLIQGATINQK